jgi:hypothetical protein
MKYGFPVSKGGGAKKGWVRENLKKETISGKAHLKKNPSCSKISVSSSSLCPVIYRRFSQI